MYKELEKYQKETATHTLGNNMFDYMAETNEYETLKKTMKDFKIPLGDLINDFIEHKNKPFWKRKHYHHNLTKIYVKMINVMVSFDGF